MSSGLKNWLGVPRSWQDVLVRTLHIAIVAFAALMLKEYFDTYEWDTPACMVDAAWVAGGGGVLNALLALTNT